MKLTSKFYLIGICGTAMASLAGMLQAKGCRVEGSDSDVYPPMSDFLESLRVPVYKGYRASNLAASGPDTVIIGNALSPRQGITDDHRIRAGRRQVRCAISLVNRDP